MEWRDSIYSINQDSYGSSKFVILLDKSDQLAAKKHWFMSKYFILDTATKNTNFPQQLY